MNKVILIGHVGKDPETRSINNGKLVANISLATSRSYRDSNGNRKTLTEWHRLNAFTPLAEIFEKYIKKGSQISVVGELQTRSYEDNTGTKRYVTEVLVRELEMLGGGGSKEAEQSRRIEPQAVSEPHAAHTEDYGQQDELPF